LDRGVGHYGWAPVRLVVDELEGAEVISLFAIQTVISYLDRIDFPTIEHDALEAAARQIEEAVKHELSHSPGGDHTAPWLETGQLHDSISHEVRDTLAAIGSDEPVAVDQEFGTRTVQPRPFFAPAVAADGGEISHTIAATFARALTDR
jgi:phage gpG-like protein